MNSNTLRAFSLSVSFVFAASAAGCGDADRDAGTDWAGTIDTLENGAVQVSNPVEGLWTGETGWRLEEELDWYTRQGARVDPSRIPDEKPAFRAMFTDDRGHLWVAPHVHTDAPFALDVFDADGRYLGRVESPAELPVNGPVVIRGDRLYAAVTDDLDVPHVARMRIVGRENGEDL